MSTEDQNLGPDAQQATLRAWAARGGVELVAIHEDLGVSGAAALERRPGLLAAIGQLTELGAGVLVAAKRDRFARDVVIAAGIERAAARAGAMLRTADGSSDASGPEGGMMRGIVDVFAQYEREVIRARTRAALAVKKARGERVGGVPFGARLAADGVHLEEDESEREVAAAILELVDRGASQRAICAELERRGVRGRTGRPLTKTQVARVIARRSVRA